MAYNPAPPIKNPADPWKFQNAASDGKGACVGSNGNWTAPRNGRSRHPSRQALTRMPRDGAEVLHAGGNESPPPAPSGFETKQYGGCNEARATKSESKRNCPGRNVGLTDQARGRDHTCAQGQCQECVCVWGWGEGRRRGRGMLASSHGDLREVPHTSQISARVACSLTGSTKIEDSSAAIVARLNPCTRGAMQAGRPVLQLPAKKQLFCDYLKTNAGTTPAHSPACP